MSDQCKSCTAKGDAKKCESLECNLHETWIVERLKKEIKDLKTWEGLMKILDEIYPEDIFPTEEDSEKRDTGPRIISLLRSISDLRKKEARREEMRSTGKRELSGKEEAILSFLSGREEWTSPTEIGRLSGRFYNSSWASPACLRLVKLGILERNSRGWYRIKEDRR